MLPGRTKVNVNRNSIHCVPSLLSSRNTHTESGQHNKRQNSPWVRTRQGPLFTSWLFCDVTESKKYSTFHDERWAIGFLLQECLQAPFVVPKQAGCQHNKLLQGSTNQFVCFTRRAQRQCSSDSKSDRETSAHNLLQQLAHWLLVFYEPNIRGRHDISVTPEIHWPL